MCFFCSDEVAVDFSASLAPIISLLLACLLPHSGCPFLGYSCIPFLDIMMIDCLSGRCCRSVIVIAVHRQFPATSMAAPAMLCCWMLMPLPVAAARALMDPAICLHLKPLAPLSNQQLAILPLVAFPEPPPRVCQMVPHFSHHH